MGPDPFFKATDLKSSLDIKPANAWGALSDVKATKIESKHVVKSIFAGHYRYYSANKL